MNYLRWTFIQLGYYVRPYDMSADRRRWFWQSAQQCCFHLRKGRADQ
jgi:hypothetical protein